MSDLTDTRRVVFYDAEGVAYQPVRHGDPVAGSVFKVKPKGASNRAENAIMTTDILDVARAMLVDGLAARCKALSGGPVDYLRFGAEKLIRYEIGAEIAQALGIAESGTASGEVRGLQSLLDSLTRAEIAAAMAECDAVGLAAFLARGRFVRPQVWLGSYPAKCLVAQALGHLPGGVALSAGDFFNGFGETQAFATLERLGYALTRKGTDKTPPKPERDRPMTTNLILYGPPGTGKTYATAQEAVALCLGADAAPLRGDRAALMAEYHRLTDEGRIAFTTFHQSMSYEEFVEGLRPDTAASDPGSSDLPDDTAQGFRLRVEDGLFKQISRRAEASRGRRTTGEILNLQGRQVFKMSMGEANNPDDAGFFEDAIAGGYAVIGWADVDWSDPKYVDRDRILEAVRAVGGQYADVTPMRGAVQAPNTFRNAVRKGDIVVVSKGNALFRAIGIFTGDYEFHPRPTGDYGHRRAVSWLWVDREGVAVSEIFSRGFTQSSIYLLQRSEINAPALERYLNSSAQGGEQGAAPDDFVLIIDEINRANISKVLGELITLLEPDKRIGAANEIRLLLPYSKRRFGVPANLHVIGTMNTADRSIALLDTALRRRFTFRELMPDASVLTPVEGIDLGRLLTSLNDRIAYLFDRDHQIGHAYFTACQTRADIADVLRHKVIPLLAEYFHEDWSKVAAVLGDAPGGPERFLQARRLAPPPGFGDEEKLCWEVRAEFDLQGL